MMCAMKLKVNTINSDDISYTSDQGMLVTDKAHILIRRNLLNLFTKEDRDKIRIAAGYTESHEYNQTFLSVLFTLFITFLLLAIPMSPAPVTIFNTVQPAGILIFPLTFIIIDSVNELFGYRYARKLCIIASSIMLLAALLTYISLSVFDISGAYQEVFGKLPRLYLINALCIIIADQLNNKFFSYFKAKLSFSALYLRCILSTAIGQIAYTILCITIFFVTSVNVALLSRISDNYMFKVGYSIALIPVTYLIVLLYRQYRPLDL